MKKILIPLLLLLSAQISAQSNTSDSTATEKFIIVETLAKFPGGLQAFYNFLSKNMKYPSEAEKLGVEGRVFVQFIVEKDGSLSDIKVVKGIGAGCDEEAVRVLRIMPNWLPGTQEGEPVRQKMIQSILFKFNKRARKKRGKAKNNSKN